MKNELLTADSGKTVTRNGVISTLAVLSSTEPGYTAGESDVLLNHVAAADKVYATVSLEPSPAFQPDAVYEFEPGEFQGNKVFPARMFYSDAALAHLNPLGIISNHKNQGAEVRRISLDQIVDKRKPVSTDVRVIRINYAL